MKQHERSVRGRIGGLLACLCVMTMSILLGACASDPSGAGQSQTSAGLPTQTLDPNEVVAGIDHTYVPFSNGSQWVYEGETEEGRERIEIRVLDETREIMGIQATVVEDRVTLDGVLVEDTRDWYAQDSEGNVWYLGEEVKNYEDGQLVDTEGSWTAGVDGALPGILMMAKPRPDEPYRQEYYAGEAEDMAQVVDTGVQLTTPTGTYNDVVITREWTPLEPGVVERKFYAPGVGLIREKVVEGGSGVIELLKHSPGSRAVPSGS